MCCCESMRNSLPSPKFQNYSSKRTGHFFAVIGGFFSARYAKAVVGVLVVVVFKFCGVHKVRPLKSSTDFCGAITIDPRRCDRVVCVSTGKQCSFVVRVWECIEHWSVGRTFNLCLVTKISVPDVK